MKFNCFECICDEFDYYAGPPSSAQVQAVLVRHKQGNRLPRGIKFDAYRHLEVNASGRDLGWWLSQQLRLSARKLRQAELKS